MSTIVNANPLVLGLKNTPRRITVKIFDEDTDALIDPDELNLIVQRLDDTTVLSDSFSSPPPGGTRIMRAATGVFYIEWGAADAAANTPLNTETNLEDKFLFVWSVVGNAGSEQVQRVQTVEIVSASILDTLRSFRSQVDKAYKDVSVDPDDFCPLGYDEGMLLEYLRGGLTIINSYQPYPTFCALRAFPTCYLQTLFDAGMLVAVNAQTLFAIDSDIEQWCFAPGTPITLADGSRKPIEVIEPGMKVIDRTGALQVVEAAWREDPPEELIEVELWGNRAVKGTAQHEWPVWAWVRECLCGCGAVVQPGRLFKLGHHTRVTDREFVHVRGGKGNTPTRQRIPKDYDPIQRLRMDEIRSGDFLMVPRGFEPIETDVNADEARLLGYYAAEGCPIYSRANGANGAWANLKWTFAETERDTWVLDIEQVTQTFDIKTAREESAYAESLDVRTVNDFGRSDSVARLVELARKHVGKGSVTKQLSTELMHWPRDLKTAFVVGALRGDGYQSWSINTKQGHLGRSFGVGYSTSSPHLRDQMQLLLAQLGFPTRLVVNKACESEMQGRTLNEGHVRLIRGSKNYVLRVPPPYAFELADLVWGDDSLAHLFPHGREGWAMPRPECMVDDEFVYVPVKSVRVVSNTAPVHNLTVSGDHSFLVHDLATFNSDQGNAFVINHAPKLAAFSAALSTRLDRIIPLMKLHFVQSGSIKTEVGPNFRLQTLLDMAPGGAVFRNTLSSG